MVCRCRLRFERWPPTPVEFRRRSSMPETLTLESTGGTIGLYEAKPDGEPRGAVIVIEEAFGVNDHIEDLCRRFAAEGYVAVAPHIYHRSGDPIIAYEDMQSVIPHIMALNPDDLIADLDAT